MSDKETVEAKAFNNQSYLTNVLLFFNNLDQLNFR